MVLKGQRKSLRRMFMSDHIYNVMVWSDVLLHRIYYNSGNYESN